MVLKLVESWFLVKKINGSKNCPEKDGAALFDLALVPENKNLSEYYFDRIYHYAHVIETEIAKFKKNGVRIFNYSINENIEANPNDYHILAVLFDIISKNYDVIIFISAGNLENKYRQQWPRNRENVQIVISGVSKDRIQVPAESIRNLSVAALNPAYSSYCIQFAPTCYTRRGPGIISGEKPDLAHVGGSHSATDPDTGLESIDTSGMIIPVAGTSIATPLVAKTAAIIDKIIEGDVSRETLMGLLLHNAEIPNILKIQNLKQVSKNFVGYGKPPSAENMLECNDHSVTMVISNYLKETQGIQFNFKWPKSLVSKSGKCKGSAKLTLVSSPPLNRDFGAECIRVDLEAKLQQKMIDGSWKKQLDSISEDTDIGDARRESERVLNSLKWSTVKVYEKSFEIGVGNTPEWRLLIDHAERNQGDFPEEGIPFSVIFTISDNGLNHSINMEMQEYFFEAGIGFVDIKIASRYTNRI